MMLGSIHAAAASLVPPNVGTGSELGKGGDVVAHSRAACVDLLHHCRREVRLDGSVHRRAHDLPPRRAQHDLHRLRIEPKIKLVPRIIYKLRYCRSADSDGVLEFWLCASTLRRASAGYRILPTPSSISAWVPSKSRTPAEKLRMSHEIEPVSCDPESAGKRLRQKSLAEWPSKLPQ